MIASDMRLQASNRPERLLMRRYRTLKSTFQGSSELKDSALKKLFSPLQIGGVTIKNRIMSTGHDTVLPTDSTVNEKLIAYQVSRARGGVGLIVLQVSGVHETARYTSHVLMATDDSCIDGFRKISDAVHQYGTKIFAQLFHPGKEILETNDGLLLPAFAPSAVPTDRYHVTPRAFSGRMIKEIIEGYGDAARRMEAGGIDGVEIVSSHGNLPAQFLNPLSNLRTDEYGGDAKKRRYFLEQVIANIRSKTSPGFVVGLRISVDEMYENGLQEEDALEAICALEQRLSYVNVTLGSAATNSGAMHIAAPMMFKAGYVTPMAERVKKRVSIPVFVTGRINQPQDAEAILAAGHADMCGMTRALIADPEMPNKAEAGRLDDIRACIACNQSCIGRFQKSVSISCIQNPVSGRETRFGNIVRAAEPKKIAVIGGGLAGMKAAVAARERGHNVTLFEASPALGGQALIAQLVPERSEFGGAVTNLLREIELSQVSVRLSTEVDRSVIDDFAPDAIILATGAIPYIPPYEQLGDLDVVQANDVLQDKAKCGHSVVIADWSANWVGIGTAVKLSRSGCRVRLAVNGAVPGELIQNYTRDYLNGLLHSCGVEVIPYARLYGVDTGTVYLQHTANRDAIVLEDVDTLVLASASVAVDALAEELDSYPGNIRLVGDCLTPRTAEEAIFEGFAAGIAI